MSIGRQDMDPSDLVHSLVFPVIWIGSKDIRVSDDMLHFRACDLGVFKGGFRKKGVVVDATLICREVISTSRAGYAAPLWGFRLPGLRHILVDYAWADKPPCVITLDEVKRLIIETKRSSAMYVGMAGSPKSYARMISNLQSYDEIVSHFGQPSKKNTLSKLWAGPFDG